MNCKFLIVVVAAIAPLALCQEMVMNPQMMMGNPLGYTEQISNSNSQAQAQAQAQAQSQSSSQQQIDQSNAALINANVPQLQAYLNALQMGPSIAGIPGASIQGLPIPVLAGAGMPGAASSIPAINPYAAQEAIAENLAESQLAAKIRNGAVQVVPPNLSSQAVLQSMHVPVEGRYSNRVYASQPLPPLVVSQPDMPAVQISSGPAAEVRAPPVVYRQPPSVVYQNEVINRHPVPLSLNPVYVKVYKQGKKVVAPRPVVGIPGY